MTAARPPVEETVKVFKGQLKGVQILRNIHLAFMLVAFLYNIVKKLNLLILQMTCGVTIYKKQTF